MSLWKYYDKHPDKFWNDFKGVDKKEEKEEVKEKKEE